MIVESVTQPSGGSMLEALSSAIRRCNVTHIDIAAAYITSGGAENLIATMQAGLGSDWSKTKKRWITSFDYIRTEPVALEALRDLPNSLVKIHDTSVLLRKGCMPITPFHPKTFILRGKDAEFVLSGSGNMSKSGLTRGHEAGILIGVTKPAAKSSAGSATAIASFRSWFGTLWTGAEDLDHTLLTKYETVFEARPNLTHPTPTEDDVAPDKSRPGQLTTEDLIKLRVCRHLWIETENIGKTLGPSVPGNQLMMKRLSRVFFGVSPADVPKDTFLSDIEITFTGKAARNCTLTFSNNFMDKLTLPLPSLYGPTAYDHQTLLLRRAGPGRFHLSIGNSTEKAAWRRRSAAIAASYTMKGGRAWGVF